MFTHFLIGFQMFHTMVKVSLCSGMMYTHFLAAFSMTNNTVFFAYNSEI